MQEVKMNIIQDSLIIGSQEYNSTVNVLSSSYAISSSYAVSAASTKMASTASYYSGSKLAVGKLNVSGSSTVTFEVLNGSTYGDMIFDGANPNLEVRTSGGTGTANRGFLLSQHNSGAQAGIFNFRKSRGTADVPLTVTNGDYIGVFFAQPYVGTGSYIQPSGFGFKVNGTISASTVPTDFILSVGSASAGSLQNERLRVLGSNGNLGIGTTAPDSKFHLVGSSHFNGNTQITGSLLISGSVGLHTTITPTYQFYGAPYGVFDTNISGLTKINGLSPYYKVGLSIQMGVSQSLSDYVWPLEVLASDGVTRIGGIRSDGLSAATIFSSQDITTWGLTQAGGPTYPKGLSLSYTGIVGWSPDTAWYSAKDTGVARNSAGEVIITLGELGSGLGKLKVGDTQITGSLSVSSSVGIDLTISGSSVILHSPDGTGWKLVIDNSGNLGTVAI